MLFKEVIHAIHPYLMKDADVPEFMRNFIQMICNIPEEEWYTKRDPSSKESYTDASLRKFYTSGPSKKLAKKMLSRLTKDNFIESIHEPNREDVVLDGLANAIKPFTDGVTKENVGAELFELLKRSLEEIVDPTLENTRREQEARNKSNLLKGKYGSGLLDDCNSTCSMPGCSHHLQKLADDGRSNPDYEILVINEKKSPSYQNICAVCHDCFEKYILKHTAKERKELESVKKLQMDARDARSTISEIDIDEGIKNVIESLANLKPNTMTSLNYEPTFIANKIDENANFLLAETVKNYVTKFFFSINKVMQNLSRQNQYPDELVRAEIKTICNRLEMKGLSQIEIYENISRHLNRITKQNIIYCNIVVCYFIQSCEVFHDITQ
ncbi:ABC-three component system protein [uncultured Dialister sp.]|jgi:hypothetical protein|uniref:ABC-three component system protein n=1 Tax=uncultured Dialister sp. TaxID=278064 RepID=UPI0027DACED1|nr:ABC-three component system protein [uncultured Dialister sp.]